MSSKRYTREIFSAQTADVTRSRWIACLALAAALATPSACSSGPAARGEPVRRPPVAGAFDYQLGGPYPPAHNVRTVERDRTADPVPDKYNICYVNAFQTQPEQAHWWRQEHPNLLVRKAGRTVQDPDWPGEYLLDTSTPTKRAALLKIVGPWLDGCARKGFDAVEPDNLDSWTRRGASDVLTRSGNVSFARLLVHRAHSDGLAIAQKNTPQLKSAGRTSIGFDFAVAEECEVYGECGRYTAAYGRSVIEIEYTDNGRAAYARACRSRSGKHSIILRDRDVVPKGTAGYSYSSC
jgi:hypothetical protein